MHLSVHKPGPLLLCFRNTAYMFRARDPRRFYTWQTDVAMKYGHSAGNGCKAVLMLHPQDFKRLASHKLISPSLPSYAVDLFYLLISSISVKFDLNVQKPDKSIPRSAGRSFKLHFLTGPRISLFPSSSDAGNLRSRPARDIIETEPRTSE